MLKDTLLEVFAEIWPMLLIFTVVLSSVRIAYLFGNKQKFVLHKELITLIFIVYILILFYVVTFQDASFGTSNYIPFKEILRYDIGSRLFFKNIIGNVLLFAPFGLFVSYYINNRKLMPVIYLTIISSFAIEATQSKIGRVFDIDDIILNVIGGIIGYLLFLILRGLSNRLPKFLKKDWIKDIIIILIIIIIVLYFVNFDPSLLGFNI